MIHIRFAAEDCARCPVCSCCTKARAQLHCLTLQVRAEHKAIQAARDRQQTEAFAALYAARAGVEGTLSQGIRAYGLRTARYRGLAKTQLQEVATEAALNISRGVAWLTQQPRARTHTLPFAALAVAG